MRIGVIGGTGLYAVLEGTETLPIETAYGTVPVAIGRHGDTELVFLNRHGARHDLPPHRIDARANIDALARCHVDAVLGINNTGALRASYAPTHLVVPHDFIDLTGRTDGTFYDDQVVHIDLSAPYCPHVRKALITAGQAEGRALHDEGVYVGVRGPRLETPAEVRWLASLGDIIGMTGCPEAALARERGLCYASLCFIANPATTAGGRIVTESIRTAFLDHVDRIRGVVLAAAKTVSKERDCACRSAPDDGRLVSLPPDTQPTWDD